MLLKNQKAITYLSAKHSGSSVNLTSFMLNAVVIIAFLMQALGVVQPVSASPSPIKSLIKTIFSIRFADNNDDGPSIVGPDFPQDNLLDLGVFRIYSVRLGIANSVESMMRDTSDMLDYDCPPVPDRHTMSMCGNNKNFGNWFSGEFRECPAAQGSQGYAGDPINTRTGGFGVSFPDISIDTPAGPLVFQRYYSSSAVNEFSQPLGPGWTHNLDTRLIFSEDTADILFKAHSLNTYLFTWESESEVYAAEAGVASTLTVSTDLPRQYFITDQYLRVYTFDENGRLILWDDGKGHSWTYLYDSVTGLLTEVDAGGPALTFVYNPEGFLTSISDSTGRTVSYDYDDQLDDLILVTDVLNQPWNLDYDDAHHLLTVTDPDNKTVINTEYDLAGRAYRQYDGQGNLVLDINYGDTGIHTIQDGMGNTRSHTYDSRNTLSDSRNDSDPDVSREFEYDHDFHLYSIRDENSNSIWIDWNSGPNIEKIKNQLGDETRYSYEMGSNINTVEFPNHNQIDYSYEGNLMTGISYLSQDGVPLSTYAYTYTDGTEGSPVGLLETEIDPLGHKNEYTYNALGQMTAVENDLHEVTSYSYDVWGNLQTITWPTLQHDWYCYDAAARLIRTIQNAYYGANPQGDDPCSADYIPSLDPLFDRITSYQFDNSGNQIAVTDENGVITRTYYDANNRAVTVVNNLQNWNIGTENPPDRDLQNPTQNIRTDTVYDLNGNVIGTINPAGILTRTYYDSRNRPIAIVNNSTDTEFLTTEPPTYSPEFPDQNIVQKMVYDPVGNQIATIDPLGIITRTYYDPVNRPEYTVQNLTGQDISVGTPPEYDPAYPDQNIQTQTVYDGNGNIIATIDTVGHVTRTYFNDLDQAVTVIQNLVSPPYSELNPPSSLSPAPDKDIRTDYYYDDAGNQIAVVDPYGIITRTYYDNLNRPVVVVQNLVGDEGIPMDELIENETFPPFDPLFPDRNIHTETRYNEDGQAIATIDNSGIISRMYFDDLERNYAAVRNLVSALPIEDPTLPVFDPTFPDQNILSQTIFDASGLAIARIANDGKINRTYYDKLNRPIVAVDNLTNWDVMDPAPPTYNPMYPDQNVTTLTTYNILGGVISVTDPDGKVTYTCYDGVGRVIKSIENPSVTDPCLDYESSSRTDQDIITRYTYDATGNLLTKTDPLGSEVTNYYDDLGRLIKVVNPLERETIYEYDGLGNQVSLKDANQVLTQYEYDNLGRLITVIENSIPGTPADQETNVKTSYCYDQKGNRTAIYNGLMIMTRFEYDDLNRLKTEIDPLDHTTTYNYDAAGNLTSITDANGFTTIYSYDAVGRRTGVDNAETDADITFTYNAAGQYAAITDGLGTTRWTYDGLRRITEVSDPNNQAVGYSYSAAGQLVELVYPDTRQVDYDYDQAGRLTAVTSWDTTITRYEYDRRGQIDIIRRPNGLKTDYTFNQAGFLIEKKNINSVDTPLVSSFNYTYDAVGNRLSASEIILQPVSAGSAGELLSDGFEAADLSKWDRRKTDQGDLGISPLAALTGTLGLQAVIDDNNAAYLVDWTPQNEARYQASFKLDPNSITMAANDAHYLLYAYDTAGMGMLRIELLKPVMVRGYKIRVESLTDNGWNTTSFFSITDAPHTIKIEWKAASSSTSGSLQLWIDNVSKQIISHIDNDTIRVDSVKFGVVEGVDPGTRGTEYFDDFSSYGSVSTVEPEFFSQTVTYGYDPLYRLTSATSSAGEVFQYSYDAVGNRLTETTAGGVVTNYTYDEVNRLTSVDGVPYLWDNNGNLLSDGASTYTYNHSNQLIGVAQGGHVFTYAYTGQGHRLRQTADGATTNYVLDTAGLSQVLTDGTATYLYGSERIAQYGVNSTDYFLGDALGNVRQLYGSSVTLSRSYEPFGVVYESQGSGATSYGFTGEWTDASGLVNLRARYYAPGSGRFMTADVWMGNYSRPLSLNRWSYVENNPIQFIDPMGYSRRSYLFYFSGIGYNGITFGQTGENQFINELDNKLKTKLVIIYPYGLADYQLDGETYKPIIVGQAATGGAEVVTEAKANQIWQTIWQDISPYYSRQGRHTTCEGESRIPQVLYRRINKDVNVNFLAYSGGGAIAYATAQQLEGRLIVDNLILLGSPWRAYNGTNNIGHIWEIWGLGDLKGGDWRESLGGTVYKDFLWESYNEKIAKVYDLNNVDQFVFGSDSDKHDSYFKDHRDTIIDYLINTVGIE